ncbi:MAG: imidazole glycerol phosphate synthase subunit HisH [Candidatus Micrarchaeia archaeon]
MIGILDFGSAGNVKSVANAFSRAKASAKLIPKYDGEAGGLSGLVVPGVGAFSVVPKIISALGGRGSIQKIRVPVLCICLGMQSMFEGSEEAEGIGGLGIIKGDVRRLSGKVRLPQLGWNRVEQMRDDGLFAGIPSGEYFYFANSYAAFPEDSGAVLAKTAYGQSFASAVRAGNWYGVQFHPEKSGQAGQRLISNFAGICRGWKR